VSSDIDRHVAHDRDARLVCIFLQSQPLVLEEKLLSNELVNLHRVEEQQM
jgi:hypothetical protein